MIIDDDDDEHYSTGYSEFCDDDTILAAKLEDELYSSPATALGKRKSPKDSGSFNSIYASYKWQTSLHLQ
jgi:hypothetical protein